MLTVDIFKELKNYDLNIKFQVNREITILFGPSGAGKTTILQCIAGITQPDKGTIKLGDRSFFKSSTKPIPIQKREIGYLFQDYALFPHMTVWKNISYGMKDRQLTNKLIQTVKLNNLLDSYPRHISGGEKQRVALVRALATKPKALLLDEPFSALDQQTRIACQDELLRLHELWKIPIVMVTHDEQEANKLGKQIIEIEKGKEQKTSKFK
ncbi:molybdate transport system ATP-binding protein [Oceanobacillus limi]|uniref:Molybdate transport system ATP-binding protein n=1 Tax=Oceanobacillus limi TaxID=930131 RepID=A0A1I0CZA4_9BACI|nr:ATP-binding cassette domain-containing protein [Oceanobacillus limi]SET24997.1 molybdate transport system ATP-binding protein [Oceanobacillus limi]